MNVSNFLECFDSLQTARHFLQTMEEVEELFQEDDYLDSSRRGMLIDEVIKYLTHLKGKNG
jgi:hypothetical protein